MYQIVCNEPHSTQPWRALEVIETEAPTPGPGEVVIDVKARPINPADILLLSGRHMVQLTKDNPVGIEGAGMIAEVGPGVELERGQVVAIPFGGTWREKICLPAEEVIALPSGVDMHQAAMLSVNPVTAVGLLEGVKAGETIVLNAANSALGRMILVLCARRNIDAIAIVRRVEAAEGLLELGASAVVVDDGKKEIYDQVKVAAPSKRIIRGLDALAGKGSGRLYRCVSNGGALIVYGLLSSDEVILPARDIVFRDVTICGYSRLRTLRTLTIERRNALWSELAELLQEGVLNSPIAKTFPLLNAAEAVEFHESEEREGKVLLLS